MSIPDFLQTHAREILSFLAGALVSQVFNLIYLIIKDLKDP